MMIPNAKGVVECECGRKNCFEKLIALERFEGYVLEMIDSKEEAGLYRKLCGIEKEPLEKIRLADGGSAAGRNAAKDGRVCHGIGSEGQQRPGGKHSPRG